MSVILASLLLGACHASTPDDLARTVLLEELGQLDGTGFVPCLSVDSKDVDASLLAELRNVHPDVVPGSECQWAIGGSTHETSGRKAMLVNVFGYERSGVIEFEARHHGKWATMKTLRVKREASGWKIVATLKLEMASAEWKNETTHSQG